MNWTPPTPEEITEHIRRLNRNWSGDFYEGGSGDMDYPATKGLVCSVIERTATFEEISAQ